MGFKRFESRGDLEGIRIGDSVVFLGEEGISFKEQEEIRRSDGLIVGRPYTVADLRKWKRRDIFTNEFPFYFAVFAPEHHQTDDHGRRRGKYISYSQFGREVDSKLTRSESTSLVQ